MPLLVDVYPRFETDKLETFRLWVAMGGALVPLGSVALMVGKSRTYVYRCARENRVPIHWFGPVPFIRLASVEELVSRRFWQAKP